MQETIREILEFFEQHSNQRTISQMRKKGVDETIVLGVPQKDLKILVKKYTDNHELALALYELDHLDARSLACMICDLDKMDQAQFNDWIDKTKSAWLVDYQLSVTLAGHKDGQTIAREWIETDDPKRVNGGYYAYSWMLANRKDEQFDEQEVSLLLNKVKESNSLSDAMAYFVETVGISYLPLYKEAKALAELLEIQSAVDGIIKMKEKGKLGFKRSYLRC